MTGIVAYLLITLAKARVIVWLVLVISALILWPLLEVWGGGERGARTPFLIACGILIMCISYLVLVPGAGELEIIMGKGN